MFERLREFCRRNLGHRDGGERQPPGTHAGGAPPEKSSPLAKAHELGARAEDMTERGEYAQALGLYEEALLLAPADGLLWASKARVKARMGDLEGARACCDRAEQCDPQLELDSERGRMYLQEEKFAEALRCLDRGLEREPGNAGTWHNKACALYGLGRLDEALGCLDRVQALNPQHAMAARMRGVIERAMQQGGPGDKLPSPAAATPKASGALSSALARAQAARQAGELDQAEAALREAIDFCPKEGALWHNLGNVLQDKRRFAEAVSCYTLELELEPGCAAGWSSKANALAHLAIQAREAGADESDLRPRFDEVIRCHNHALSLTPQDAQCWMNLGSFLMLIHEWEGSIAAFEKARGLGHPKAAFAIVETKKFQQRRAAG